ncbi:MAG: hypothetical protein IH991_08645, partial [Planctomycetes bacterium]|nr:hypothetical protein [Planctomycetota bacterium]
MKRLTRNELANRRKLRTRILLALVVVVGQTTPAMTPLTSAQNVFQSMVPVDYYNTADHARNGIMTADFQPPVSPEETTAAVYDPVNNFSAWLRHIQGQQLADNASHTAIGGTWFNWRDDGNSLYMLVGDAFITNDGEAGMTAGLVHRRNWNNSVVGAGAWFDIGQSRFTNFAYQQIGFTLEWLTWGWNLRVEGTTPIGAQTRKVGRRIVGNPFNQNVGFFGHGLATGGQIFQTTEVALKHLAIEMSRHWDFVNLPWLETYLGYYVMQGHGIEAHGIKGGFRGNITPNFSAELTISSDDLVGTNVFGGGTIMFGLAGNPNNNKLTSQVYRNDQVPVTLREDLIFSDLNILTNGPTLNGPGLTKNGITLNFVHVDSADPGGGAGLGTFEDPLTSLDEIFANSNSNDVIIVHGGTIYEQQSVVMQTNQQFLGEGLVTLNGTTCSAMICTDGGFIPIPETAPGASTGPAPTIFNSSGGTVITLAQRGNVVAGFHIDMEGGGGTGVANPGN